MVDGYSQILGYGCTFILLLRIWVIRGFFICRSLFLWC